MTRALGRLEPSLSKAGAAIAALLLALFLAWAWLDGGFAATTWLPGTLFVTVLAAVALFTRGGVLRERPLLGAAVAFFAVFTVWNAFTIVWADDPAAAWDGTNRTLLYLAVLVVFLVLPYEPRAVPVLLGGYSLGTATLAGIAIVRATTGTNPAQWYIEGRLAWPMDYANGNAALFLAASWPALYLASRREVPPVLRGAFLAATGVLVEASLLCQSRGSLFAVPIVAVLAFAFSPGRLRLLLALALVATAVGVAGPTLLDVYDVVLHQLDSDVPVDARWLVLATCAALFVVGTALGLADRAVTVPRAVARALAVALSAVALTAVVVGTIALLASYGDPRAQVSGGWDDFKSGRRDDYRTFHFVSGLGSNRYDLWRVALLDFERAPVVGIGADNYARSYIAERRYLEEPLYPHSLPLRLLSQTGIVGTLLFTGFLACMLAAAWQAMRRATGFFRGVAVAALALTAYWLLHGAVDWFWEIPALAAPALAALAFAVRVAPVVGGPPGRLLKIGAVAAALVAVATALPAYLAARNVTDAAEQWPSDPQLAFDRLELARKLNPLSDEPDVITAIIAQRLHDPSRERTAWSRALERNPDNWYALLKLSLLDLSAGKREAALRRVAAARQINPLEPIIVLVQRRIRAGRPVTAAEVDRLFLARADTLQRAAGRHPRNG
jgi:O-Antigen ligase